jgi:hypothetical protein
MSHLEGFNDSSDQVPVRKSIDLQPVYGNGMNHLMNITNITIKVKDFFHHFFVSDCWRDDVQKCLWVLPLGVIFTEYIGMFLSSSITFFGFIVLVVAQVRKNDNKTLQSSSKIREVRSSAIIAQVQNCRLEVSRILGLVGAPALDWMDLNSWSDMEDQCVEISSKAVMTVVNFLEAHVQFLVTVDEAYQWLRVSASLHLGLGPRSRCVDRVERASIARSLRNGGTGRSSGELIASGGAASRRFGSQSIVPLSNVRDNLARQMVDQYHSILQVRHCMQEKIDDVGLEDPLCEPVVVDLAWIRDARQRLEVVLSDSINTCATTDALILFTANLKLRACMEDSMSSARNAREYLQSHLQLGEPSMGLPNHTSDPLHSSLLNYREHLFGLLAATWSCQQYTDTMVVPSEDDRRDWWSHMQRLSADCREIESDIERRFFHKSNSEEETNSEENDLACTDSERIVRLPTEVQLSDDGTANQVGKTTEDNLPTKTTVFKGHGAKRDRPTHTVKKKEATGETLNLPPRDATSERLMIQELRSRIMLMRSMEEEEEEESDQEIETEIREAAKLSRETAPPVFLGASGLLLSELKMSLPMSTLAGRQEEEVVL